ncbi:porin [Amphritea japonica]|uniref:Outer membrane protein n=1 Tax=Amphritea japonica ATCC BAA-1530 TaxID=1278309 RepID=A0A7R6SSQ8_9GAMM|nr:porin [Amphritea japonica]BBB25890.1 outer membrane protein [Amphritea japonica ATCC BAA-1530]
MNNKKLWRSMPLALAVVLSNSAMAEISLYDQDGTTFSVDGHFNAFYTYQDSEDKVADTSVKTSRVRMGFLPNYIGFNVSKQIDDLKVGGRSSFWVSINDSNQDGDGTKTDSMIDVRQFYATVDGDFGQVLFGKDFGLYGRSNIFGDELLMGVGFAPAASSNTTFGNITTGYPYANPTAQITYRSPVMSGLQVAVGVLDPNTTSTTAAGDTNSARFETEATYTADYDGVALKAWVGGAIGDSVTSGVDASGISYGARVAAAGFALTASGFNQEGISHVFASNTLTDSAESEGYLVQGSYSFDANRVVLSYGQTEATAAGSSVTSQDDLTGIALFHKVNDNLGLVAEYTVHKTDNGTVDLTQTDTFALGATLSW